MKKLNAKSKYVIPMALIKGLRFQIGGFSEGMPQLEMQEEPFLADEEAQYESATEEAPSETNPEPSIYSDIFDYARAAGHIDAFDSDEDNEPTPYFRSSLNDFYDQLDTQEPSQDTQESSEGFNDGTQDYAMDLPGDSVTRDIVGNEGTGGQYNVPSKIPGSSATGKYQFVWSLWGDEIGRVTGVGSKQEFLHNPQAQEDFYKFYRHTYMEPFVEKNLGRAKEVDPSITAAQLAKMFHYAGPGGIQEAIQKRSFDWVPHPEAGNTRTLRSYGDSRQTGGTVPVATSSAALYRGLNDPQYAQAGELILSRGGTVRGLDSGVPVRVSNGETSRVLLGPHDMIQMNPLKPVYERILK